MKLHHVNSKTNVAVGQRSQQSAGRFLCFKPIDVEFEYVKDKKALFYEDKEIKNDSSGEKGSKRKGFSRALKAILFRSKSRTKNSENREGDGSCSFRFGKRSHELESEIGSTKSLSMRSTSSSCSSSSSCLSSHLSESSTMSKISFSSNHLNPKPLKQNSLLKESNVQKHISLKKQSSGKRQQQQQMGCGRPAVMGMVLIAISLALTILWGRLWAIGLNAVWLCSIPKQGRGRSQRKTLTAATLTKTTSLQRRLDSEVSVVEQKRRVIMEGLLDRRHHHQHFHHHHHRNCQQQQQPV